MISAIEEHRLGISDLCRRYHVRRLDVFGSAARGTDFQQSHSDADFLVQFDNSAASLIDFVDLKEALERLLVRRVDLIDRRAIETSRNHIRRRAILEDAESLYAT